SSLVDESNTRYVALHGGTDAGEPTARGDDAATDRGLEEAWLVAGRALGLPGIATRPRGRVKPLLASPILRRLGLSGVYCPFTAEATVNAEVPAVSYPQVVAHEKSHQRGIHPEDEANFLGWFVAECSRDPLARYSASVFAQRQLLFALLRADPDRARDLIARRHPGVQRDVDALRAYWTAAEGPAADAARRMNDAYLRTNRVEGGIESYGRSVQLMLRWAASHEGSLRIPGAGAGATSRSD
ncbi:MAG: DUF3810 family protein, partial [Gemmatimonadetes bacterium]|nr:DUF3810 family protein [Gemmatimonadota bacterium]